MLTSFISIPYLLIFRPATLPCASSHLLDNNLRYYIPLRFHATITNQLIDHVGLSDDIIYSNIDAAKIFQWYMILSSPTTLDWTTAYAANNATAIIMKQLPLDKKNMYGPRVN